MKRSNLGYPYFYGDELSSEIAQSNKKEIKGLTILLLVYLLKVSQVQAAPLPGADVVIDKRIRERLRV